MRELHTRLEERGGQGASIYRSDLPTHQQIRYPLTDPQEIVREARAYLHQRNQEHALPERVHERLGEVEAEIERVGSYWHTSEELVDGARMAWRNSTRCIGRLHWKSLIVRDLRHLATAEEIFQAIVEHLLLATNGGKIRPMMSVFAPQLPHRSGIRIWNPQIIRYAGYHQPDESITGDPAHIEFTEMVRRFGWRGGAGTAFDVLPLVIQMPYHPPQSFELPREAILEVPVSHPDYAWFAELGLKWHALPLISNMRLEIGGITDISSNREYHSPLMS